MNNLCEGAVAMFSEMSEYNVDSVTELQHCIERELADVDLKAICDETECNAYLPSRKYGTSAELMGVLGYYHPSLIFDRVNNNVKRGRLIRKEPVAPKFVYDFNLSGNLIRIMNTDLRTVTHVIHGNFYRVCISIEDGTGEIVCVTIIIDNERGQMKKWIQFQWYFKMKVAYLVFIEIYQYAGEGVLCTSIEAISKDGIFGGLCYTDYSIILDSKNKITSVNRL